MKSSIFDTSLQSGGGYHNNWQLIYYDTFTDASGTSLQSHIAEINRTGNNWYLYPRDDIPGFIVWPLINENNALEVPLTSTGFAGAVIQLDLPNIETRMETKFVFGDYDGTRHGMTLRFCIDTVTSPGWGNLYEVAATYFPGVPGAQIEIIEKANNSNTQLVVRSGIPINIGQAYKFSMHYAGSTVSFSAFDETYTLAARNLNKFKTPTIGVELASSPGSSAGQSAQMNSLSIWRRPG